MMKNVDKAPFPWFGGKAKAADLVWRLIGDVPHYVEPFYGSGAVLLNRPHPANRPYYSETVNDLDGFVVNFWRAVQWYPDDVAHAASWPVSEADKSARQIALLRWRDGALDRLAGDACWCDPLMAGWWAWAVCVQIGGFDGKSGWTADPSTGKIYAQPRGRTREPGVTRNLPNIGSDGRGVNRPQMREPGVARDLPNIGSGGGGVNHPGTREPGVVRGLPHLGDDGRGVNHPGTREPGVARDLPNISGNGQGVNHPGTREPGVLRSLPNIGSNGGGVNHPGTREPGVTRNLPNIGGDGQGVNHPGTREPGVLDVPTAEHGRSRLDTVDWGAAYHDLTMPELIRWLRHLAARLRHVRILNGDWSRLVTTGAAHTLPVRQGHGPCGVFLDPPYADSAGRNESLYACEDLQVAHDVRAWCLANGDNPRFRIVLAGFEGEHGSALVDAGWTEHEWFKAGFLSGGMGNIGKNGKGHQMHRDRLWSSPHCLPLTSQTPVDRQITMFTEEE